MDATAALAKRLAEPHPLVMGVLNVTPDSFSDGGRFFDPARARAHAEAMCAQGADIIDIGGESTRPGSQGVDLATERERVLPLIEALMPLGCPLSLDTSKPELMVEAARAGVAMINDVNALRAEGATEAVAGLDTRVCLMHMQGEPRTMQVNPHYDDVIGEIGDFLAQRLAACQRAGIASERLIVDPGFGFGKNLQHNVELLARLDELGERLGQPLLVGMSRKRMIGALLGDAAVDQRVHGSIAAAVIACMKGARIIRAHDVQATREALAVAGAVCAADRESRDMESRHE